ncbi:hypothetical protein [Sphingobium lactosutens]|uniref:Uncharacterized protein n=1 Tax=Sphingobium lactosutens DS20 TaxID=1331060 RepID=T0HXW8_9SPHN|nr:hypothetical protein [Sphingobium lactosutens]EQB16928.1 hypothetical protein RLDS_05700 [Sphingobium lactosutens DS20]
MDDDLQLPLHALRPIEIQTLKEPGLIFPVEPSRPLMAFTLYNQVPTAIFLTGGNAFKFFPVKNDTRGVGLFLAAPEIVVSLHSAARSEILGEQQGTLLLQDGQAHIIGSRIGDDWADPVAVPLWQTFETPDAVKAIGFYRWSIRFTDGLQQRTIWQFEGHDGKK